MKHISIFRKNGGLTILAAFLTIPLCAQSETKLTASDGEAGDVFGQRAVIEGEYILVGASEDDNEKGNDAGAAYVFRRNGETWAQTQKLLASDISDTAWFGYAIDIDGDYAVISACWSDEYGAKSGSAYIFKLEGSEWIEEAKLTAHDATEDDRFGISASISGDYAVIGSFFDDDYGSRSGSAYVFKREGSSWTEQAKLTPNDGAQFDWFGVNVSIEGDYIAVGSRLDDNEKGLNAGSVYIYKREGTEWTEQMKLMQKDSLDYAHFEVCEIEDDKLVVGAWGDAYYETAPGSFYICQREMDDWIQIDKLQASDVDSTDLFGRSVAINNDRIVIGSYLDDDMGDASGSCYVFRWDGSNWYEEMKLTASDGDIQDYFGLSVDIDQHYLVAGARQADDKGENAGAVYVFQLESTTLRDAPYGLPHTFELMQNYPNPFQPSTKIEYTTNEAAHVSLVIYNSLGQVTRILVNKYQRAGRHQLTWDGRDENGNQSASGEYYYQLFVGKQMKTKKAVLISGH